MSAVLQHSIGRQVVECHVNVRGADAYMLQERVGRLCREALPAVLEAALDGHAPAGAVLRIDTLTVDLGRVGLSALEAEVAERLRVRLAESLRQLAPATQPAVPGAGEPPPAALEAALIWFLRYGTLPAWCRLDGGTLAAALQELWRAQPGPGGSTAPATSLRAALEARGAIPRLLTQFDTDFRRALLDRVQPGASRRLDLALDAVAGAVPATAVQLEGPLAIAALRLALDARPLEPLPLAAHALALATVHAPAHSPARPVLRAFLARHVATYSRVADVQRGPVVTRPDARARDARVQALQVHPDQAGGLAVDQAGVVLLHPFLPRLFAALGFVSGTALTQPDRALAMLHYLCTGARQAPEAALALPKALCAVPLTAPVDGGVMLSDAECAEAEAMLAAVIAHWGALRNTSADGLRGAFLLRPGVLRERDGEWHLRVQADTADILLDSLPWGLHVVRLPWMRGMLWVEWR